MMCALSGRSAARHASGTARGVLIAVAFGSIEAAVRSFRSRGGVLRDHRRVSSPARPITAIETGVISAGVATFKSRDRSAARRAFGTIRGASIVVVYGSIAVAARSFASGRGAETQPNT